MCDSEGYCGTIPIRFWKQVVLESVKMKMYANWIGHACVLLLIFGFGSRATGIDLFEFRAALFPDENAAGAQISRSVSTVGGVDLLTELETGLFSASVFGEDVYGLIDPPDDIPDIDRHLSMTIAQDSISEGGDAATAVVVRQRGAVGMNPLDSLFQDVSSDAFSRVVFTVTHRDGGEIGEVDIKIEVKHEISVEVPPANESSGAVLGGSGVNITKTSDLLSDDPRAEFEQFGLFDIKIDDRDIELLNDFDESNTEVEDLGDGAFDITIETVDDGVIEVNEQYTVDVESFLSAFIDGFDPSDVDPIFGTSLDTFELRITSPDPNVRFHIEGFGNVIPEPGVLGMIGVGLMGLIGRHRRR